jgi:dihydroflavonol-4-reductase
MRVFVTGLTGFIGQALADRLLARGWGVRALARDPGGAAAQRLAARGVDIAAGDVTERESMRAPMQGCDAVIHAAAWYELGVSASARARMRRINVDGTENVLALASELRIPRTTYVSSVVAYGDTCGARRDETFVRQAAPLSVYEQSKADAHALALGYARRGLPVVTVCPGNVIGPNDQSTWGYFARLYVNGVMPPLGWSPNAIHSHVAVEDVAEGVALAAERGRAGEVYLLAGDRTSPREVLELWSRTEGGLKFRMWLPPGLAGLLFAPLEPLQRRMGIPAFISRETVRASRIDYDYSSDKAMAELGWRMRPVGESWPATLLAERELRALRPDKGLAAMVKPLPVDLLPE